MRINPFKAIVLTLFDKKRGLSLFWKVCIFMIIIGSVFQAGIFVGTSLPNEMFNMWPKPVQNLSYKFNDYVYPVFWKTEISKTGYMHVELRFSNGKPDFSPAWNIEYYHNRVRL